MWLSLRPKLILLGGILLLLGISYGTHKVIVWKEVRKAVAQTQEQMSAEYTKKLLEASERAREREQVMVASADRLRKDKDAQIASLNSRLGTALDGLRQRPQRSPSPEGSPASCTCQGATGASLSREDAEFLVREAGRADSLRAALQQCYRQYDSVRESLK